MGRKKAKRTKPKRVSRKLETRFDCLKCNHENVVHCKIIKNELRGYAICEVCEAKFRCPITPLDKPIDIFHYWADSLEKTKLE